MNPADKKLWLTEKMTECLFTDRRLTLLRTVYEAPDHRDLGPYYSLKLGSYAVIVAVDEVGNFICVRQFRQGIRQVTTEFPAGGIVVASGEETVSVETAFHNAKRELLEETGYVSGSWTHLFTVPANSTLADNYAFLFLATGCVKQSEQKLDKTEYLEAASYAPGELEAMIRSGDFQHPIHILAWYLAKERLSDWGKHRDEGNR